MDIIQLFEDFNIPYETEGKHAVQGWINIQCPFCNDHSFHLGFNLDGNYFNCWKCGWHPLTTTLSKLINLGEKEIKGIVKQYGLLISHLTKEPIVKIRAKAYRMPSGTGPLTEKHISYLEKRHFDARKIERIWNLVGTGAVSLLDGLDYKHRIIVPVTWDQGAVSFVGRDVTGKSRLRYRVCPKDREIIHHKHIIYGKQEDWKSTGICVEGPTDTWRLGTNSFATFGIEFTPNQVRTIAKYFTRVFILFDQETQAQKQAAKLVSELKFRGVEALIEVITDPDPGSMKQSDADYLVKQLIR